MKQVLRTFVLTILLGTYSFAQDKYLEDLIPIGSTKQHMCAILDGNKKTTFKGVHGDKRSGTMLIPVDGKGNGRLVCHGLNSKYWHYSSKYKTEIISNGLDKVFFVYGEVTKPMSCTKFYCWKTEKRGTGKLIKVAYSQEEAFAYADPTLTASFLKRKKEEEKKKITEKPKKKQKPKSTPDDNKIVPAGSGSGFFVSKDGHAITNYHVIEGCDINKLSFKGSQTEVKVLAVDKVNDIAILKSNVKPDVIFPVSNEDISLLEDVIVAGFPLGKQISSAIKTHKGVVTALAGVGDNYSFFQTDAAINQGNSGGPIINQKGNVVGIAVATWVEEGVQGVHFGIKSSTLKTFASANGLSFASPNFRDQSNKALGELITKGTVYVECHMTVAKIKKMIAQAENRKAFFKEHK
tara:strand:- start:112 stop:1332 length:1221 start_codon:yes stop_codon:yes gene_type:complete